MLDWKLSTFLRTGRQVVERVCELGFHTAATDRMSRMEYREGYWTYKTYVTVGFSGISSLGLGVRGSMATLSPTNEDGDPSRKGFSGVSRMGSKTSRRREMRGSGVAGGGACTVVFRRDGGGETGAFGILRYSRGTGDAEVDGERVRLRVRLSAFFFLPALIQNSSSVSLVSVRRFLGPEGNSPSSWGASWSESLSVSLGERLRL
jgi:hypothetical protein